MKLKNIFKKKTPIQHKEAVRIAGHTFRVLDPVKMSNVRRAKFMLDEYSREWGMTKQDIIDIDTFLLEETSFPKVAGNLSEQNAELADKLKRIYAVVSQRQAIIKEDYQYKPFLRAAGVVILMDDEDEYEIDNDVMLKKMELCKTHLEIEAFFLTTIRVFQLSITNSLDISKISTWFPSTELKIMENNLLKQINTTIYEIGGK